jgi:hypothetical protein
VDQDRRRAFDALSRRLEPRIAEIAEALAAGERLVEVR